MDWQLSFVSQPDCRWPNVVSNGHSSGRISSLLRSTIALACVFRANSDSDSNSIRTLIPIHFGQRFRSKSDSDSDLNSDTFSGVPESCSKGITACEDAKDASKRTGRIGVLSRWMDVGCNHRHAVLSRVAANCQDLNLAGGIVADLLAHSNLQVAIFHNPLLRESSAIPFSIVLTTVFTWTVRVKRHLPCRQVDIQNVHWAGGSRVLAPTPV